MSNKRNNKKKEGSYTTTTLINKQITVCKLKDEIVYQIYKYDWDELKSGINEIKHPNRLWATLYSVCWGMSASAIIPVIDILCREGVATMYKIAIYAFSSISVISLIFGFVFFFFDRKIKEESSKSVKDVLGKIGRIESKIYKQ